MGTTFSQELFRKLPVVGILRFFKREEVERLVPASVEGGLCNIEEHRIAAADLSGVALRCFDKAAGRWAIYWVSERHGLLQPPVYGGFAGDIGLFEGDDFDSGRPVKVRFEWTRLMPGAARWEQAFSYDDGQTWETNWVMDFRRHQPSC